MWSILAPSRIALHNCEPLRFAPVSTIPRASAPCNLIPGPVIPPKSARYLPSSPSRSTPLRSAPVKSASAKSMPGITLSLRSASLRSTPVISIGSPLPSLPPNAPISKSQTTTCPLSVESAHSNVSSTFSLSSCFLSRSLSHPPLAIISTLNCSRLCRQLTSDLTSTSDSTSTPNSVAFTHFQRSPPTAPKKPTTRPDTTTTKTTSFQCLLIKSMHVLIQSVYDRESPPRPPLRTTDLNVNTFAKLRRKLPRFADTAFLGLVLKLNTHVSPITDHHLHKLIFHPGIQILSNLHEL